jgi:hypothetical protein
LKLLSSRMLHYACWPTRCTAEWPFCYWSLFSVSELWSPKSEVWSLKSEVRSPKSEVWSLKSLHGFRRTWIPCKRAKFYRRIFPTDAWLASWEQQQIFAPIFASNMHSKCCKCPKPTFLLRRTWTKSTWRAASEKSLPAQTGYVYK